MPESLPHKLPQFNAIHLAALHSRQMLPLFGQALGLCGMIVTANAVAFEFAIERAARTSESSNDVSFVPTGGQQFGENIALLRRKMTCRR